MKGYVVKNPYEFKNLHVEFGLRTQYRICGEAIKEYLEVHNLSAYRLAKIVNEFGKPYGIRFTPADIHGYIYRRVSPKAEKMMILCRATGMPMSYWAGRDPGDYMARPIHKVSRKPFNDAA